MIKISKQVEMTVVIDVQMPCGAVDRDIEEMARAILDGKLAHRMLEEKHFTAFIVPKISKEEKDSAIDNSIIKKRGGR